jgi:hypothetical protein
MKLGIAVLMANLLGAHLASAHAFDEFHLHCWWDQGERGPFDVVIDLKAQQVNRWPATVSEHELIWKTGGFSSRLNRYTGVLSITDEEDGLYMEARCHPTGPTAGSLERWRH